MSVIHNCETVAAIIKDYRAGEIAEPDAAHVERWAEQFPAEVRRPLLAELGHVLSQTYVTKEATKSFLKTVATSEEFTRGEGAAFWRGVHFLRLQQVGNSQRDMLKLFDATLREEFGFGVDDCGAGTPHTFLYLDDGVFSGGRLKSDLVRWIESVAPARAEVAIIVMSLHLLGQYFATNDVKRAADAAAKTVNLSWWRAAEFEDRKAYIRNSDVLRPKSIPPEAQEYVASLGADPILRTGNEVGALGVFSSAEGRELLEQEFLKAGVRVRKLCPNFNVYMRPLGCTLLRSPGFGTTFVTFRNIANNTPLVLWAGNPWYPLFPRRTN